MAVKTEWVHNGVKITLTDDGMFEARVGASLVRRASLRAIRALIKQRTPFKPFKALAFHEFSVRLEEVEIVGLVPNGHAQPKWQIKNGGTRRVIYPLAARAKLKRVEADLVKAREIERKARALLQTIPVTDWPVS